MATDVFEPLPRDLAEIQQQMEHYARGHGLDFFPTVFEVVEADQLNEVAAYGGFPVRYPHWRFGMEYEQLAKGYFYGLQKIYELVINNNPCYAYLMKSNALTDQKMVMAHVYGHCDFFKNNYWFSQTNRKMMDQMANHGMRVRRHMDRFGVEEVENFIDACLSIEDLIDMHLPFIKRHEERVKAKTPEDDLPAEAPGRFDAKHYMDTYINPPEALAAEASAPAAGAHAKREVPEPAGARCDAVHPRKRRRSSRGRPTCCRSFATKPIISLPRAKPRS